MRNILMASIAALVFAGTVVAGVGSAATTNAKGGGDWPYRVITG